MHHSDPVISDEAVRLWSQINGLHKQAIRLSTRITELYAASSDTKCLCNEAFQLEMAAIELLNEHSGLVEDYKWRAILIHNAILLAEGAGKIDERDRLLKECPGCFT